MAISPRDVRALFPAVERHTWLNAAASSPIATPVFTAVEEHLKDTVQNGDLAYGRWQELRERLRGRLAKLLSVEAPTIGFVPSTSMGFSVIGSLLKGKGVTEVLTLEGEFPSTTLPLLQRGLTLKAVKRRPDGSYPLEDLEAALTPVTGAIALSAVQYSSGYRVDLSQIGALCRIRGLKLAINAAQALGQVPINAASLGADFVCAPSHKWMMGGYGLGMIYASPSWHDPASWPFGGWLSVADADLFDPFAGATKFDDDNGFLARGGRFKAEPASLEAGSPAWSTMVCLDAAMSIHEDVGVDISRAHVVKLQTALRAELRSRGFVPNSPDDVPHLSGICTIGVQGNPNAVVKALMKAGVVTSCRGGGVRISTHVFNDEEDLARLYAALDSLGVKPWA